MTEDEARKFLEGRGYFVCRQERVATLKGSAYISSLVKTICSGDQIEKEKEYTLKKKARELGHDALHLGLINVEDATNGDGERYRMTAILVRPEV